jgi:hypothetical protein
MLEDFVPDAPKVFSIFGVIVARLIVNQCLPMASLIDICQPLVDSPSKVPQGSLLFLFLRVACADVPPSFVQHPSC